jgi:hypothetical protein
MTHFLSSGSPLPAVALLLALAPVPTSAQEKKTGPVAIQAKLAENVRFEGVDDPKVPLGDVLESLERKYSLNFVVNEKALRGRPDVLRAEVAANRPLPRMSTSLGNVVQAALTRVDLGDGDELTYVIRRDRIEITTRQALDAEFYQGRPEGDPRPPLVIASVKKVPLEDALNKLAQTHDINIVLDARVGEAARTPVSAELTNVPLDTAVRLLADMAGLKSVQIDNVVYVTTPANAAALQKEQERKMFGPFGGTGGLGGVLPPAVPGMDK